MKVSKLLKPLLDVRQDEIKRVREDVDRMSESCIGVEDIHNFVTGKNVKPRAIRDWEKNHAGR